MTKLALALCVALVCFLALDVRQQRPACYTTPQATVTAYWQRMIEHRMHEALDCFMGPAPRELPSMLQLPELVELRCRDFEVQERAPGVVDVNYHIEFRVTLSDSLARFPTGDRLRLTASGWKIDRPLLLAAGR